MHCAPPALTCGLFASAQSGEKQGKVTKLSKSEVLMLNIGSMCTGAKVLAVCFSNPQSGLLPDSVIAVKESSLLLSLSIALPLLVRCRGLKKRLQHSMMSCGRPAMSATNSQAL